MAFTLQNSINFVLPFVEYLPVTVGLGQEPAVGTASIIRNTILDAPQAWYFNRNVFSFDLTQGVQDYSETIADFGYAEKVVIEDDAGSIWELKDVYNNGALSKDAEQQRPSAVSFLTFTPGSSGSVAMSRVDVAGGVMTVYVSSIAGLVPGQTMHFGTVTGTASSWLSNAVVTIISVGSNFFTANPPVGAPSFYPSPGAGPTFTGDTGCVTTANTFTYNGSTTSVEFTFMTSTTAGGFFVIASPTQSPQFIYQTSSGDHFPYFAVFMLPNGKIEVEFFDGSLEHFTGGTTLSYNDGNPHVCVVTLNGTACDIYIDGALVQTFSATTATSQSGIYWRIANGPDVLGGSWPTLWHNIQSYMADVAVWQSVTLNGTQVAAHYAAFGNQTSYESAVAADSPDSFWHLSDGLASTTAVDSTGSNTGTYLTNTPLTLCSGTAGALTISGANTSFTGTANSGIEEIRTGDTLFGFFIVDPVSASQTASITAITDNQGNTWAPLGVATPFFNAFGGREISVQTWYAVASAPIAPGTAMSLNITVVNTSGSASVTGWMVSSTEVGSVSGSQATAGTISGGQFTSPALTIAGTQLVFSAGGSDNSSSVMSPFTGLVGASGGNEALLAVLLTQGENSSASISAVWSGNNGATYGVSTTGVVVPLGRTIPSDANTASITFGGSVGILIRFQAVPDKSYTATVTYQKKAQIMGPFPVTAVSSPVAGDATYSGTFDPLSFPTGSIATITGFANPANNGSFTVVSANNFQLIVANSASVAQSATAYASNFDWSPLPDWFADVYNNLFLSEILTVADDPRAEQYRLRGISAFMSKSNGLTEMQKNIFALQWLARGDDLALLTTEVQQAAKGATI